MSLDTRSKNFDARYLIGSLGAVVALGLSRQRAAMTIDAVSHGDE